MKAENIPENNLVVLFFLMTITLGMYYFWWIARVSRIFNDNPVSNVLLIFFTAGFWAVFLNLKYMQKSEDLNGREMKWIMVLFIPVAFLVIQQNLNEKYYPGR